MTSDLEPAPPTAIAGAVAAEIHRLAHLAISGPDLDPAVAVLDALAATEGPLLALAELLASVSTALSESGHEDLDHAANHTGAAGSSVTAAVTGIRDALRLLRPLAV